MERERSRFRELIEAAKRPVAITGAGVSAEGGVPTRSRGGLWRDRRPEDLATAEAFRRNPGYPTPLTPRATLAVRAPTGAFLSPLLDALPASSA